MNTPTKPHIPQAVSCNDCRFAANWELTPSGKIKKWGEGDCTFDAFEVPKVPEKLPDSVFIKVAFGRRKITWDGNGERNIFCPCFESITPKT